MVWYTCYWVWLQQFFEPFYSSSNFTVLALWRWLRKWLCVPATLLLSDFLIIYANPGFQHEVTTPNDTLLLFNGWGSILGVGAAKIFSFRLYSQYGCIIISQSEDSVFIQPIWEYNCSKVIQPIWVYIIDKWNHHIGCITCRMGWFEGLRAHYPTCVHKASLYFSNTIQPLFAHLAHDSSKHNRARQCPRNKTAEGHLSREIYPIECTFMV